MIKDLTLCALHLNFLLLVLWYMVKNFVSEDLSNRFALTSSGLPLLYFHSMLYQDTEKTCFFQITLVTLKRCSARKFVSLVFVPYVVFLSHTVVWSAANSVLTVGLVEDLIYVPTIPTLTNYAMYMLVLLITWPTESSVTYSTAGAVLGEIQKLDWWSPYMAVVDFTPNTLYFWTNVEFFEVKSREKR